MDTTSKKATTKNVMRFFGKNVVQPRRENPGYANANMIIVVVVVVVVVIITIIIVTISPVSCLLYTSPSPRDS